MTLEWAPAARLVVGLRLKRTLRKFQLRRTKSIFFPIFIGAAFVIAFTQLGFSIVNTLHANVLEVFGSLQEIRIGWYLGFSLELTLLWFASLLLSVADRELAKPEWDLEWLVTFPISLRKLIFIRVIEKTFSTPGIVIFLPFIFAFGWTSGLGFGALEGMLLLGLPLMLMSASLQTILDTGLKLKLAPANLRNLQAVTSIVGVILMYVGLSPSRGSTLVVSLIALIPEWFLWSPFGLVAGILGESSSTDIIFKYATLWGEALAFVFVAVGTTVYQLRNGVVAHSGRDGGRKGYVPPAITRNRHFLTPLQARELKLLVRDRNFLVQTLLLPILIIGSQLYFNSARTHSSFFGQDPRAAAAVVFGLSAYGLMFSAFQTLNFEGHSLWILFCLPRPLADLIRDKTRLWSGLVMTIYPAMVLALYFAFGGSATFALWAYLAMAVIGIPIYGFIAAALGVFGSDPQAMGNVRTTHVRFIYLYMALASIYTVALLKATPWQMLTIVVLTAGLSAWFWKKAVDQLPYLLDPAERPRFKVFSKGK